MISAIAPLPYVTAHLRHLTLDNLTNYASLRTPLRTIYTRLRMRLSRAAGDGEWVACRFLGPAWRHRHRLRARAAHDSAQRLWNAVCRGSFPLESITYGLLT